MAALATAASDVAQERWAGAQSATPIPGVPNMTIDLTIEPQTLDPALTYQVDGWSVVHSVYDSLLQFGPDGSVEPLLAESFALLDPMTYEVKLRQGITFHNGEPFDAGSVVFSLDHLRDPAIGAQAAQNFAVIESTETVDAHTVRFHLSQAAPWLPSQIAPWLVMLPPLYAGDPANDFANNPVGTGPYRFLGWDRGQQIRLERNSDYFAGSAKGQPIADTVSFRFVGEATTRVADLLAGTAQLIRDVPVDQLEAVAARGANVLAQSIAGCAFVRIPTDVVPFDNAQVRQALNHAVDIDAIVQALVGGEGRRLASFFVEGGLGYDPNLAPFTYDPERARQLLADAGYADGFDTQLAYASGESADLVAAIAAQLTEVGVRTEPQAVELATFNSTWQDPASAPLRFLTWRPLFDPYTLLSLVVSNTGFLSRFDDPAVQALIEQGASEPDPEQRAATYQALGEALQSSPAAIYGYALTAFYGVASSAPPWTARPDEYMIPTWRGNEAAG